MNARKVTAREATRRGAELAQACADNIGDLTSSVLADGAASVFVLIVHRSELRAMRAVLGMPASVPDDAPCAILAYDREKYLANEKAVDALVAMLGKVGGDLTRERLSSSKSQLEIVVFGWGNVVAISGRTVQQTQAGGVS